MDGIDHDTPPVDRFAQWSLGLFRFTSGSLACSKPTLNGVNPVVNHCLLVLPNRLGNCPVLVPVAGYR